MFGTRGISWWLVGLVMCLTGFLLMEGTTMAQERYIDQSQVREVISQLIERHGDGERSRLGQCVPQVARFWQESDGSPDDFVAFCRDNYIANPETRKLTAERLEVAFASIYGHMREMSRDLSWNLDIETGPILPIDYQIGRYSPYTHLDEDLFITKVGFSTLLNYPQYTLNERLERGSGWSRDDWMQSRLAGIFDARVPAEISQKISDTYLAAGTYLNDYNIHMHHLLAEDGSRPFPSGMKLITHWNLRDEIKSLYSDDNGLPKQEMIYTVMQKIIRQEIPSAVINNPAVDWKLSTNEVTVSPVEDGQPASHWKSGGEAGSKVDNAREPDTRYQHLLNLYHAVRAVDPYYPALPTMMDRRFEEGSEIPEAEIAAMFESILGSPVIPRIGKLIEKRLGRKLRAFDIWYDGFKTRGTIPTEELDKIVGAKYPTVEAFENDIPNILTKLGFTDKMASWLAAHVDVDPSRGAGHASGPGRKAGKAHLRTRVPEGGMDYKGYNIAIHELGHNIEQVISLNKVDHTLLRGVPNTAITEGFAFVFQGRDLDLLGISRNDSTMRYLKVLDVIWGTYEIAGVALVDMGIWNWMYAHPEATPADVKAAIIEISAGIWNDYFAPTFGERDIDLLAIYSHIIEYGLYVPSYPLGHIIAFQVEQHMTEENLATEMERMCTMGSVTPDLWMRHAVGGPISTEPMLIAADKALDALGE